MVRRLSPADAVACAAAGVGAWFTRASLDVFPTARGEARVAMFPAPVEIVGLVVLGCLCAFLLRTILSRRQRVPPAAGHDDCAAHLLLPFVSVLAVAVAYVPWIADLVPAWRAAAGPARFALWGIVCGQAAWMAIDSASLPPIHADTARPAVRRPVSPVTALGIAAAWLAITALAASRMAPEVFEAAGLPLTWDSRRVLGLSGAAIAAALASITASRVTSSGAAASTAWLAVAGAAPVVLSAVLVPEAALAAACVAAASAWGAYGGARDVAWALVGGSAIAVLPWIDAAYLPAALVLASCLAWRTRTERAALMAAIVPLALTMTAAFAARGSTWIAPVSAAPIGWPAAGALFDQRDGLLLYAPAVALAVPGLWHVWREGGGARVSVIETVGVTIALLLTAGWTTHTVRSLAVPGIALVPALPLAVAPIARWLGSGRPLAGRLGLTRLLALYGLSVTIVLACGRGGALVLRGRDGASRLLEWLAPARDLVRVAPMSSAGTSGDATAFIISALIWTAVAGALCWIASRLRLTSVGVAAPAVTAATLVAITIGAASIEAALGPRLTPRIAPALRTEAAMLSDYDARRRPLALAYDGWRSLPPSNVPPLFTFDATPGVRRYPQPLRVLLNTRLSLPAGDYVVTLQPRPGAALAGRAGLQVGRIGPPMREWELAGGPGQSWSAAFTLPVDASFVGLRTAPDLDGQVAALRIQPARVVNGRDRRDLPPVLSSAIYGSVMVTFHGDQVYAERDGFWVRGRASLLAAFTPSQAPGRQPGVRLSLHGGDTLTHVRFETGTWTTTVALEPGVSRELLVPALEGQALLPVRISPDNGFVPADVHGGRDRRLLGCWVEVLG